MLWYTGSNIQITWETIIEKCAYHHSQGGRFYVGCDSHIHANKCSYVEAICLHGANGQQGGAYFYRRENSILQKKVVLRERITNEASRSINLALELVECLPQSAQIEVHLDISPDKANATGVLSESLTGYAKSAGFVCKIKPESWAASSIADVQTR